MRFSLLILCSLAATPAAGEFSLELPVDCVLDESCHIQQFVDHDPTSEASDFMCGRLTYDGHKGTDFALPSLAEQAAGVAVIAAASGTVVAVRDGMADALQIDASAPDVTDRECGNGVVIRHPDGWETQYCHLANGSVAVQQNQQVSTGDTLGMIGLSGRTQFPHLHLSVRKNGQVVDPFALNAEAVCAPERQDVLWSSDIATPQGGLIAIGFADHVPTFDAIKAGTADAAALRTDAPVVLWAYLFGGRVGDTITFTIQNAGTTLLSETVTLERNQAALFRAIGRRAPAQGWPQGAVEGTVTHERDGQRIDSQSHLVDLR